MHGPTWSDKATYEHIFCMYVLFMIRYPYYGKEHEVFSFSFMDVHESTIPALSPGWTSLWDGVLLLMTSRCYNPTNPSTGLAVVVTQSREVRSLGSWFIKVVASGVINRRLN